MMLNASLTNRFGRLLASACFNTTAFSLLWKRLIHVRAARGDYITEEEEMRQKVPLELAVPNDLATFLSCIGHFSDPSDRKYELVLQAELDLALLIDGASGSYGIMNAGISNAYSCLPSTSNMLVEDKGRFAVNG